MNGKCISFTQQGKSHSQNEDALSIVDKDTIRVAVLADGVSNSIYGKLGAQTLTNWLSEFLVSDACQWLLQVASTDEIKKGIIQEIDLCLDQLVAAHAGTHRRDFASTLLATVEMDDGLWVVHAGDGCIFMKLQGNGAGCSILSYPDNSPDGCVYEAGNEIQDERIRLIRLPKNQIQGICLATDGFSDAFLRPENNAFAAYLLADFFHMSKTEIAESIENLHIQKRHIGDDISCIFIRFDDSDNDETSAVTADTPESESVHQEGHPTLTEATTTNPSLLIKVITAGVVLLVMTALIVIGCVIALHKPQKSVVSTSEISVAVIESFDESSEEESLEESLENETKEEESNIMEEYEDSNVHEGSMGG